jgi:hypothetical protein
MAILQISGFQCGAGYSAYIFFTALFFLLYKKFAAEQSWRNTLLLALSIAFLFYTPSITQCLICIILQLLSNISNFF